MYELIIKTSESGKSKYFGFMLDGEFVKCASKKTALILISKFNSLNGEINDLSSELSNQSEQPSGTADKREYTEAERSNILLTGNPWGQPDPEAEELGKILESGREARARADEARARADEARARVTQTVEEIFGVVSELSDLSRLKLSRFGSQAELRSASNRTGYQLDPETVDVAHQSIS